MKTIRLILAFGILLAAVGVAYVAQENEPTGSRMSKAATKLLESFTPEQRQQAMYPFDDPERYNWHFIPLQDKAKKPTRKGVRLEEMTSGQKEAALELLKAGTSALGYREATGIMSLESLLNELEKGGANVRNPGWYFFTVFGSPGSQGYWGWRVEGHHLSLNFTVKDSEVIGASPALFGSNPATVMAGTRKNTRTLAQAEDLAKALYQSLDDDQKKIAKVDQQFREIEGKTRKPTLGKAAGIEASKLGEKQRKLLNDLLQSYVGRMPADVAKQEWKLVEEARDNIHFAFAGGLEQGQPHSYRVQGPKFVVEFLNVQADSARNPANHIHSAWRRVDGDFGQTP